MKQNTIKVSNGGVTITLFNKWVFVFFAKMITLKELLKQLSQEKE